MPDAPPPARTLLGAARLAVCIALTTLWAAFTTWLFVYAMPWSSLHALLGLWALLPSRRARRGLPAAIFLSAFLTIPLVGIPEYAATTNALHCRTLGFTGARAPADCAPAELARGEAAAKLGEPLFTPRERLGLHGFNHLLALGGLAVGLPEVAWETVALSWTPSALPAGASVQVRRAQCRASWDAASAARAALGPPRVVKSDFPMRSAIVRARIAEGAARLRDTPRSTPDLGEVHFVSGSTNIDAYSGALLHDSVRVALALEVGDSRLHLVRHPDGTLDAAWTGTIHYPGTDIAFAVPLPWGPDVLRVSEAVFCGMHVDGAMNPYRLTYLWTLAPNDPRLTTISPDRGPVEAVAAALLGLLQRGR